MGGSDFPASQETQDFVVVGGGPAGSSIATFLAARGYRVTVLEKERFPRDHVGESLLPFCYPLFEKLGVLDEMSSRFVRKPGARFVSPDGSRQTTWCFKRVIHDPSYLSFHVIRSEFDQLLLENAEKRGATVLQGAQVSSVERDEANALVTVHGADPGGSPFTVRSRFLIDASGRSTFLASKTGGKTPLEDMDRIGLSNHWANARYTTGVQEGLIQIVYLGGEKKGWIWVFPVGTDRVSVGVVLNHSYVRERRAELRARGESDRMETIYEGEIRSSPFVGGILADARPLLSLMVDADYSYSVRTKFGSWFATVGDACAFVDPIFSSGVYLAMNSAWLLSEALDEVFRQSRESLSAPELDLAPLEKVYAAIEGAYALVNKAVRLFYNPEAISFAEAGYLGKGDYRDHEAHEAMMGAGHHLLAGDFFGNPKPYSDFIDRLSDRSILAKFTDFIAAREGSPQWACGSSHEEIFPPTRATPD